MSPHIADADRVVLATLRRNDRFQLVEGDAITYRYLWLACNGVTCADHRGEWVTFDEAREVLRCS